MQDTIVKNIPLNANVISFVSARPYQDNVVNATAVVAMTNQRALRNLFIVFC